MYVVRHFYELYLMRMNFLCTHLFVHIYQQTFDNVRYERVCDTIYVPYTIELFADVSVSYGPFPAERINDKVAMCMTRMAPKYLR